MGKPERWTVGALRELAGIEYRFDQEDEVRQMKGKGKRDRRKKNNNNSEEIM